MTWLRRWLLRFGKLGLVLAVLVVVVVTGFFASLPEIVRQVAVRQVPKAIGRQISIEDIDLNLFTGYVAVKKLRLAEREGTEAWVEFERLEARLSLWWLVLRDIRVRDFRLVGPAVRIVRGENGELNFQDLLPGIKQADIEREPTKWTFTLDRAAIERGRLIVEDRAVSPAADWSVRDLEVETFGVSTRPNSPPGRLKGSLRTGTAALELRWDKFGQAPFKVSGSVKLTGFDLTRVRPYLPSTLEGALASGALGIGLNVEYTRTEEAFQTALASGDVTVENVALLGSGAKEPLLAMARLGVGLRRFDLAARDVTLSRVELSGLDARLRRDKSGQIDLLALAGPGGEAASPASKPWKVGVERTRLGGAKIAFTDETVEPPVELTVSKLDVAVDSITWPVRGPASLSLSAAMPGAGTLKVQGPVTLQPLDAQLTVSLRDAAIEPYQSYMPVAARFSGRFNGDSRTRIAIKGGKTILSSKGSSWAEGFEARLPGAQSALIAIERMDLVDIDFDWPTRVSVGKVGFTRPVLEIERAQDGTLNINQLFKAPASSPAAPAPPGEQAKPAAPSQPAAAAAPRPAGLLETIKLEFPLIHLEEGSSRFIDRTTEPAFSEDLSKMDLLVTGLSNASDSKAKLVFTTVVGGHAGLDIRGNVGAVGAPLFIDLAGEIRDLQLAAVNPYAEQAIAWLIRQGDLTYKFTIKIDHDQLTAVNDVVVGKLKVVKSKRVDDKVKARLGLPLGLIVALVKDLDGNIVLHVPVAGSLKDPKFDLSDVIWSSIKHVLVNVLTSPFRLIGSLFSRGDKIEEPKVSPVTFQPGSAALSPSMEQHLVRVADFMRRTPYVGLTMHPVVTTADVDALKSAEVAAKIQRFAKERGIAQQPQAVPAYFQARVPSEKLPETTEDQLKRLRDREPVPEAKVKELEGRRLAVTKERLVKKEGIQDKRLPVGEAKKPGDGAAEGRVEFAIGEGEEE